MTTQNKMEFPLLVRELRILAGKKQREVAEGIGLKEKSYANVECTNHKSIRVEKVHRIARYHDLDPADTAKLVAAWEALPLSEFGAKRREFFARRNEQRKKSRAYDEVVIEMLNLLDLYAGHTPWKDLCGCEILRSIGRTTACKFCICLSRIGLPTWSAFSNTQELTKAICDAGAKLDAEIAAKAAKRSSLRTPVAP